MEPNQTLQHHLDLLRSASKTHEGMDVVIVVTGSAQQEAFWQEKLTSAASHHFCPTSKVIVVHEDWPGGAGNGLGTLYAYKKAVMKAKRLYQIDLPTEQENGASVAMYHTAGKGTRLAPLPGCEQNNKSAVKLPCFQDSSFLTILEGVILQTSLYAAGRKGRLSVFWGDQIFIPSKLAVASHHHADILGCLSSLPSREEWEQRGLSRYGLLTVMPDGQAKVLDKIDYDTVLSLQSRGVLSAKSLVGTSLGSFSISFELLCDLLDEFASELHSKKGKLDSDPHLWMPMTLDEPTYIGVMAGKGMAEQQARHHYRRMQSLKKRVQRAQEDEIFFSAIDVGCESYWWDFGSVKNYFENCLKLTHNTPEGHAIRAFFSGTGAVASRFVSDNRSFLQGCEIKQGRVENSVLVGVKADHLEVSNCVIINSQLGSLKAEGSLLYGVKEAQPLQLSQGSIRTDIALPGPYGNVTMYSALSRDGQKDWNQRVNGNPLSYAELYLRWDACN